MHDRMPVLLKLGQFEHWLSGDMGVEELKPIENDYLQRWAVSKRINSSKADSEAVVRSLRQPVTGASLFGYQSRPMIAAQFHA